MERSGRNPILTRTSVPAVSPRLVDVSSVFNPGAVRFAGRVMLVLRVQTRGRETVLMPAESSDGETFKVLPRELAVEGIESVGERVHHVYDPRLTEIDGAVYMVFAADTDGACGIGVASSRDLKRFELVSYDDTRDARNGVLFPEKVGGRYLRLERPNRATLASGVTSGDQIVLAESDDLASWREVGPVMAGRPHFWDELIGSGPPPVKTRKGWLHVYHGVAMHLNMHLYQAGVCLLDLADPTRVVARGSMNILEPREPYELTGQVPNVVFPTGMIADELDAEGFAPPESRVRIYYGAADTVVCLATTTVGGLLEAANA
jgi:beta-1,4-mannooligosaccharide/beta-1,4-mannosyl-N-acetylglucosamine phosphorylase